MAKKILSFALLLCICIGLMPISVFAAESKTLWLTPSIVGNNEQWEAVKNAVRNAEAGDTITIVVSGVVALPAPLVNSHGASFIIKGNGQDNTTIKPDATSKSFDGKTYLFTSYDGDFATPSSVVVQGITFDEDKGTVLLSWQISQNATKRDGFI